MVLKTKKNKIILELYDGKDPDKKCILNHKLPGLMDTLFPITSNLFGGYRNDQYLE